VIDDEVDAIWQGWISLPRFRLSAYVTNVVTWHRAHFAQFPSLYLSIATVKHSSVEIVQRSSYNQHDVILGISFCRMQEEILISECKAILLCGHLIFPLSCLPPATCRTSRIPSSTCRVCYHSRMKATWCKLRNRS
jgi:hypothetical protein